MKKQVIALAAVMALTLPLASYAAVSHEIIIGETTTTSMMTLPDVHGASGEPVLLNVVNPTGSAVTFSVPSLGISSEIPADSSRTFYISVDNSLDRNIAYEVTTNNGDRLAAGNIINDSWVASDVAVVETTTVSTESSELSAIEQAGLEPDPEPAYYESTMQSNTVRGFW